jgi:hypothetical protein
MSWRFVTSKWTKTTKTRLPANKRQKLARSDSRRGIG